MYSDQIQRHLQKIQYSINKFNGTLLLVKGGSETFEDVKIDLQKIRNELKRINK